MNPVAPISMRIALAVLLLAAPASAAIGDITLLGSMGLPNSVHISDISGYVDTATMREYAVIADWDGHKILIIDATDPANMSIASEVTAVASFDVKVWANYIYACDGTSSGTDSWIIDISDPTNPVTGAYTFPSGHNVAVSTSGILYVQHSSGLHTLDLNPDPLRPLKLAFQPQTDGHDITPKGTRLYDFRGALGTYIMDVSNPGTPIELGVITDPDIVYHHSGDATESGTHLLIADELGTHPTADITIWDISNPGSPFKVSEIADATSTVHNVYVVGDLAYVSYYASGFKVFDISNPGSPVLADQYDTSAIQEEGFTGAFGVYPFAPDNRVYVSDIDNGLFVFEVQPSGGAARSDRDAVSAPSFSLMQNTPNPFNPSTTISYELALPGHVTLDIYGAAGGLVRRIVDELQSAGAHRAIWNGRAASGASVASGVYLYRLTHEGIARTRRMVLIK